MSPIVQSEHRGGKLAYEYATNWSAVTGVVILSFAIVAIPMAGSFVSDSKEDALNDVTTSAVMPQPFLKRQVKLSHVEMLAQPVAERPNTDDVEVATPMAKPPLDVASRRLAAEKSNISSTSTSELPLVDVATGEPSHSAVPTEDPAKSAVDNELADRSRASSAVTHSPPVGQLAWLDDAELAENLLSHSTELDPTSGDALSKEKLGTTELPRPRRRISDEEPQTNDDANLSPSHVMLRPSLDPSVLVGLPLRDATACQTDYTRARVTQRISQTVRRMQARISRSVPPNSSYYHTLEKEQEIVDFLDRETRKHGETMIPVLVQMLPVEKESFRHSLIELLQSIDGNEASRALAQRALYDLSSEVRSRALEALKNHPQYAFRQLLIDGLRYPWPPVAHHAATALVGLGDKDAVPQLVKLLDKPDPQTPFQDHDNKWVVRELVRVNHLRNCLLCHAPSTSRDDLIRAPIPSPSRPLPVVYYSKSRGPQVRADVVYLKQDFSTKHAVDDHDPWPQQQRFDYFLRTRAATDEELATVARDVAGQNVAADEPATILDNPLSYPQREAVLYALRELTSGSAQETRDR